MTPDQYRREGAEAMRKTCVQAVIYGTPYSAGGKAFADAIRAIDVDAVLAGLPPITGGQSVIEVCPICDGAASAPAAGTRDAVLEEAAKALESIAENWDCGHPESRLCDCGPQVEQWVFAAEEVRALKSSMQPEPIHPAPDAVARLVEAARVFANWDHCWPGNINLEAACRDIREALAAMEANDDLR